MATSYFKVLVVVWFVFKFPTVFATWHLRLQVFSEVLIFILPAQKCSGV